MTTRIHHSITALALLLGLGMAVGASAESLEERLRNQLRSTTQQLQALQSEQAQSTAARQAAQTQLTAAQEQIKQLTADLAKARTQNEQLGAQQDAVRASAQAQVVASNEQVNRFKQAYEELLGRAREIEATRVGLATDLATRDADLQQCSSKNEEMYGIAKEILTAYENIEVSDVLKIRQPFASGARVKFEELVQRYGDELYQTQFDATKTTASN
ncbi:DNA repair protein [Ectopseudomonas chengduensis]|nr:DNA repair protein [Pseudomonas chengduensis]UZT80852.1 DNA repair protein [Pseudomonas chengduensis]